MEGEVVLSKKKKRELAKVQQTNEEVEVENPAAGDVPVSTKDSHETKNKQKVLLISTRGITARSRHLMEDFRALIPHSKKDSKVETRELAKVVNDMAEIQGCNKVVLFDVKRMLDVYIHMGCPPFGPTVKFHAFNIHTMLELNFSGNHLKGSRPIVSFDAGFDNGEAHWKLIKEILTQIFATPRFHKRSKPFVDHILTFSRMGDCIWMRNYQIAEPEDSSKPATPESKHLVEVGPRVVLQPVRIFEGSLKGSTIWKNHAFIPPNHLRNMSTEDRLAAIKSRKEKAKQHKRHMSSWKIPESAYDAVLKHAGDIDLDNIDGIDVDVVDEEAE